MSHISIISKDNENIKYTNKLLKSRSFREQEKRFVLEGIRLCSELIKDGAPKVVKCFVDDNIFLNLPETLKMVYNSAETKFLVKSYIIEKITDTKNSQGIVCVCENPSNIFDINEIKSGKYIALENISDPGNLGTILRAADGFGLDGVIITCSSVDIYNQKVLRASMGSGMRIPIFFHKNSNDALKILKNKGIKTYATVLHEKSTMLTEVKFPDSAAVFMGNEANGLLKETYENCDKQIFINMSSNAESLNVSVAAGVIMWELNGKKQ